MHRGRGGAASSRSAASKAPPLGKKATGRGATNAKASKEAEASAKPLLQMGVVGVCDACLAKAKDRHGPNPK